MPCLPSSSVDQENSRFFRGYIVFHGPLHSAARRRLLSSPPPQSLENSPFLFGSLAQQYEEALYRAAEDTAYKFVAWRG